MSAWGIGTSWTFDPGEEIECAKWAAKLRRDGYRVTQTALWCQITNCPKQP